MDKPIHQPGVFDSAKQPASNGSLTPHLPHSVPRAATTISVIVPVHNAAQDLKSCLEAVRSSTYPHYECIVVDDGSTDDSLAVARRLADQAIALPTRGGPARARNVGVRSAAGEILFFIDADVGITPRTIEQVAALFAQDPTVDAIIGSYDDAPAAANFISQYKNLFHHFVHQQANEQASTFWSGCGAIRRELFLQVGGFNEGYTRPCIEDIELGYRLHAAHRVIRLNKNLQVKHLKRWTLWGLLKSDVLDRGIPWTMLMLQSQHIPNDLNLRAIQRISALLAYLLLFLVGVAVGYPPALGAALLALLAIILMNWRFYAFFVRRRGLLFATAVIPLHILYYWYSGVAFAVGLAVFLSGFRRSRAT
jgi:glycosyltransferase involved in cell wall biosynthesis